MRAPDTLWFLAAGVVIPLAIVLPACSADDDGLTSSASALRGDEQIEFCQDIEAIRTSLVNVRNAGASGDQAALQDAVEATKAAAGDLSRWSRELQGGNNELDSLDEDIANLEAVANRSALLATPGELDTKVDAVSSDLDSLDTEETCP